MRTKEFDARLGRPARNYKKGGPGLIKPSRNKLRMAKRKRIRRKIQGTSEKPRLCVFRSLNHIYAQVIDDVNQNTLVSASTLEKDLQDILKEGTNGCCQGCRSGRC